MRVRLLLMMIAVALFSSAGHRAPTAAAQSPAVKSIPETPAGQVLKAWLEAFNSGDRAQLEGYYQKYQPDQSVDEMIDFRKMTGGFDLLEIRKSQPLQLEFLLKERNSETKAQGLLTLGSSTPIRVTELNLRAMPSGGRPIDASTRARVIDSAIALLADSYVFPEVAAKMGDAVRARLKHGDYDSVTDGSAFADRLTDDFRAVSHDRHLMVMYSPAETPVEPPGGGPDSAQRAQFRTRMLQVNCAFAKVEVLAGNVGYLKLDGFGDPDVCGPTAAAAMAFLAHVDALIIDLRGNGGGDPRMVAVVCSYLFEGPTHLNDLWERKGNVTRQYWTLPYVPGTRLASQPVFVLTSKRTFSGGEEFAYDLKNLKRATLIGETTGGGAHPVSGHRIDAHFMIGVPFAKPINPVSQTDWEGTGVEPDVKVPSAEALATAQRLATEKLAEKRPMKA